eukprot:scaffold171_cov149-Skeletonema_dohrnii-CCMP3373.AAC.3
MILDFVDVEHVLFVASDTDEARDLNIPKRNSLAKRIGIYISRSPTRPLSPEKVMWLLLSNASSYRSIAEL